MKDEISSLKVVDLFAGAGGFGLGFHLAGYQLIFSLEKDLWAAETLRFNKHSEFVFQDDIKSFTNEKQVQAACPSSPDVVIGGPPCQGFSIAGSAKQKDPKDPRNSLFKDFARWVEYLQPKVFVMENVRGILSRKNSKHEKVIDIITRTFRKLEYDIEIWILNAACYGVPQMRERVFIVGRNYMFSKPFTEPPRTHYIESQTSLFAMDHDGLTKAVTAGDAILDLPPLNAGEGQEEQNYSRSPNTVFQKWARGKQTTLYNHVAMEHTTRITERFRRIQAGNSLDDVPSELKVRKRSGNGQLSKVKYDSNYRHIMPNDVSFTIPASFYSSFIHPNQPRNITAREAARIQSFPDWYRFMGKRTVVSSKLLEKYGRCDENHLSQYNQIGNAVPPLLSKAIAEHLSSFLLDSSR